MNYEKLENFSERSSKSQEIFKQRMSFNPLGKAVTFFMDLQI